MNPAERGRRLTLLRATPSVSFRDLAPPARGPRLAWQTRSPEGDASNDRGVYVRFEKDGRWAPELAVEEKEGRTQLAAGFRLRF